MGDLFGGSGSNAMAAAAAQAAEMQKEANQRYDEALQYYESIGVPTVEAQKIALQVAELGPSAMEDIETDPRLRDAQMGALSKIQEMGESGLTASERAEQMMMQRSAAAQQQAQEKAILQNMAERGLGGSGNELIARLQSTQSSADRNAMAQAQLAGQAQQRALQAMLQGGQLGGQIRGQEFGEQQAKASAADRIAQFNAQNRANTLNQQEMYNKGLIGQQFGQQMQLAGAKANTKTGQAASLQNQAQQRLQQGQVQAEGEAKRRAGTLGAIGTVAGAGIGAMYGGTAGAKVGASVGGAAAGLEDGGVVGYEDGGITEDLQNMSDEDFAALSRAFKDKNYGRALEAAGVELRPEDFEPDYSQSGTYYPEAEGRDFGYAQREALERQLDREQNAYQEGGMVQEMNPEPSMQMAGPSVKAPNNNGGFMDGGIPKYAGGGVPVPDLEMNDDRIIPGEEYEGDRVDAKINSGEMVLNIEQQQRLMELLKGLRDLQGLGDEDIIEPVDQEMMAMNGRDMMEPSGEIRIEEAPAEYECGGIHKYKGGGMVPAAYDTPTEAKPRGLHASMKHEKEAEEKANAEAKARKARIKAYETLINGGR